MPGRACGVVDLTVLAEHLEPLARRDGQRDEAALVEHLLDLVGLRRLVRDLAASPTTGNSRPPNLGERAEI